MISEELLIALELHNLRCDGDLDYQPLYEQALRDWVSENPVVDTKKLQSEIIELEERIELIWELNDPDLLGDLRLATQEHIFRLDQLIALKGEL